MLGEFKLNDENAIPFLFEYGKKNKENKVRITTGYGSIDIESFNDTPYHRANFIYLIKNKYFQGEYFHRVKKILSFKEETQITLVLQKKRRKLEDIYFLLILKKDINIIEEYYQCQVVK